MVTQLSHLPEPLAAALRQGPFALLHRQGHEAVEVLTGELFSADTLAELPVGEELRPSTLAIVPFRQIRERGFVAIDDGAPLRYLRVANYFTLPVPEVLAALPATPPRLAPGGFDVDEAEYTKIVRDVITTEIGQGQGSNFVIHRTYSTKTEDDPLLASLAVFRRLLEHEHGAYWTFCVHTPDKTFVGASPERHVSVSDGVATMNPISGTHRHDSTENSSPLAAREGLLRFLRDPKEIDELFMVLDEELKMMAAVADLGGQVLGPYLKEMTHLTHTEYLLAGYSSRDVRTILRETMFAPTVVGSPVANACRVIARHERHGRGYYGGVLALLGRDEHGNQTLDAPILIRCAVVDADGTIRVPVGATLVRHSIPEREVAETAAKAGGVLSALGLAEPPKRSCGRSLALASDPAVIELLESRNAHLAKFWRQRRDPGAKPLAPELAGRRVLVVDAEDNFTGMLVQQLRALGLQVTLRSYLDVPPLCHDLVVAGPGPGDPGDGTDRRITTMRRVVSDALAGSVPLLGVCLGHQILAGLLGLPLVASPRPRQGVQKTIDFFGRPERVGFYSTFAAVAADSTFETGYGVVNVCGDPETRHVNALRGPAFAGVQFHIESVLTEHGVALLRDLVSTLCGGGNQGG